MTARVQTVRSRSRSRSPEPTEEPVKLHVSNLPLTFPQQQLSDIFSKFGPVQDVRIIRKGSNGQPLKETCYGFVVLATREAANRALKELNSSGMSVSLSRESRLKAPVAAPAAADCPGVSHPERSVVAKTRATDGRKRIFSKARVTSTALLSPAATPERDASEQTRELEKGFIE